MFRSVLSVFLGFVLMAIIAISYSTIVFSMFPEVYPLPEDLAAGIEPQYSFAATFLLLCLDLLTALGCGYFTAAIARRKEKQHANALAILLLIMGGLTLITTFGMEPIWYALLRLVGAPVCVAMGGIIRYKQRHPSTEEASA